MLTDWDEASCTRLVYLYTEVARNFGGDARRFFQVAGKKRGKAGDGTLTIASIDVGGGTTDLIVNNYRLEGAGASVTLFPEQKFREDSTSRATTSCCASCKATCCRPSRRRCAPAASPIRAT